jgi:hypothetical protein
MADEKALRRPTFVEGRRVVLADGQSWSLPTHRADRADPEYDAILRMVREAEDASDRLRSELALTIFLLSRNYQLTPDVLQEILGFSPDDPALVVMQQTVHALAVESMRDLPEEASSPIPERPAQACFHWNLLARFRTRRSLRHN